MKEEERQAFAGAYDLLDRFLSRELSSAADWEAFARSVGRFAEQYHFRNNVVTECLAYMIIDVMEKLHKGASRPAELNYFGRSDLS